MHGRSGGVVEETAEGCELNLLKKQVRTFALSIPPAGCISITLNPVISFIPVHIPVCCSTGGCPPASSYASSVRAVCSSVSFWSPDLKVALFLEEELSGYP